jgi:hypothetical protein
MIGFDLPPNYHLDPESLIRKSRSWFSSPGSSGSQVRDIIDKFQGSPPPPKPAQMSDWKCINDFLAPSSSNVRTRPEMNIEDGSFKLKPSLINMVHQSPFCGKASEDVNAHIQYFLEIYSTFTIRGVTQDVVCLCLFPFSLLEKAKQWFYSNKEAVSTREKCSNAFLAKFFFHWARPMPFGTRSLPFNNSWMKPLQGMRAPVGLYLFMPPSRHGVVHHPKLLSWADSHSP